MTSLYNANIKLNSDKCWMNAKDNNNGQIESYNLYFNDNSKQNKEYGSYPSMSYEHVNLRGRTGYGATDDYLVDVYSSLMNNPDSMTRDRCPIQLTERLFAGGPKLTGIERTIDKELDVLSGVDTRTQPIFTASDETVASKTGSALCNKQIMEKTTYHFVPLLDCIKEVQNHKNIVPEWTMGGEDTRSYVNKQKFNRCNPK